MKFDHIRMGTVKKAERAESRSDQTTGRSISEHELHHYRSQVNSNRSQQNIQNYIKLSDKIISLIILASEHLRPEMCLRQQRSQSLIPAAYGFRELD